MGGGGHLRQLDESGVGHELMSLLVFAADSLMNPV